MRGGTHFGEAGETLFGAFATAEARQPEARQPEVKFGQRGTYRGWSEVFQGFVVDGDDEVSVFTTEEAARAWAAGE